VRICLRSAAHRPQRLALRAIHFPLIFCTGPLTSSALADSIRNLTGEDSLAFFDAIAPIVHADSIDFDIAWKQSRYDKPGPGGDGAEATSTARWMRRSTRRSSRAAGGAKTEFQGMGKEHALFRRLPADRGDGGAWPETLRFGPMKPVGLMDPRVQASACGGAVAAGQQAWHAVQHGRLPDEAEAWRAGRIFRMIPGLRERAVRAAGRHPSQHVHQLAEIA
jgi:methylenetetrahydrofolate--tRNA-(uracil-5-)-methyltransferase